MLVVLAACALGCAVASPAAAKDMSGKFGIGFSQSLTNKASGLRLSYWVGDLKIGALAGVNLFSFNADDKDTELQLRFAAEALYAIARTRAVNLSFGGRVVVGLDDDSDPQAGPVVGVDIELPLEAEYYFSDHFAIFGQVGIVFQIVGTDGSPLSPDAGADGAVRKDGFGFGIGMGGFAGGVGFTFYF